MKKKCKTTVALLAIFLFPKSCVDSNRHMRNFNEVLLRGSRLQFQT